MKILYHFRTQGTGAEGVHIAGIATAFERLGHTVVFSSPTGVDPRRSAGANPFGAKRPRSLLARLAASAPALLFELLEIGYNAVAFFRNRALVERERCDLIYERHAFFLCSTALLASSRRIPLVIEVNELAGDERVRSAPALGPLARFADRLTFSRASLIVVVSPHLKRRIEALGIPSDRIVVLPNAVAEESLSAPADGARVRQKLGLESALVVGFVGWFVPWHRLDVLLAQIAGLSAAHADLRLLLVGDGDLKEALRDQAARLGIADRVVFAGAVAHGEMPDFIAAMDVCVVPHSNEYRSPIKLFEYMACGRAVLAPRLEPVELIIRHGENGVLFQPGDAEDMGRQLTYLIENPPLRARLGAHARIDVRERYTWTKNAEAVLARAGAI